MRLFLSTLVILILTTCLLVSADDSAPKEKAEFLIKLVENIEWSDSGTGKTRPVQVAIVGSSPVTDELVRLSKEKNKVKVDVEEVSLSQELSSYHLVFTPTDDLGQLAKLLKKVGNSKIFTVSSSKDFARYGIMVNLFQEKGKSKIKYELNKMVIDGAGLKLKNNFERKAEKI
jgi:hypothetical protein